MFQRKIVEIIAARMREDDNPLIQVVAGPHQTGKSTAIAQTPAEWTSPPTRRALMTSSLPTWNGCGRSGNRRATCSAIRTDQPFSCSTRCRRCADGPTW